MPPHRRTTGRATGRPRPEDGLARGAEGDTRKAVLVAAGCVVASLAVYLATMAPSLPVGHDSGELITAAAVLGIAHPPGYPLYVMLGHLFSLLPVGDLAWRLNLMSAVLCALAVGCVAFAATMFTDRPLVAAAGALMGGLALTPWRQAVGAEKYALDMALVAGLMAMASLWKSKPRLAEPLGALLLALALTYHYTALLVVPGLAVFVWMVGRRPGWRAAAWFAVGLLPLAYLPLRAAQHPALDWGNPSDLHRFLWVVTREGYGVDRVSVQASGTALSGVGQYFSSLVVHQFPWGLVLPGLLALWWRPRGPLALLGLAWLGCGPVLALLAGGGATPVLRDMISRYFAVSYLLFGALVALGLARLPRALGRAVGLAGVLLMACLHWPAVSLAGQYQLPDTVQAMLARLPRRAVLAPMGDMTSGALLYYTRALGERPDLQLVFPGLLGSPWYQRTLPPYLARSAPKGLAAVARAVKKSGRSFYTNWVPRRVRGRLAPDLPGFYVPRGLVYQYLLPGEPVPARQPVDESTFHFLESRVRRGDYRLRTYRPVLERALITRWANAYRTVAQSIPPKQAAVAARRVLAMDSSHAKDWLALGSALQKLGDTAEAKTALRRAVRLDPNLSGAQQMLFDDSRSGP